MATSKSITSSAAEQQQVQALERVLHGGVPALVSPAGERIELPRSVFKVLREAVGFMSHGRDITLVPDNKVITTQRAADVLGMSRPFFIKLLDSGVMAHHRVGNQRRVYLHDVLEYASKRDKERLAALDRLANDAFEAGLYERNVFLRAEQTSEEASCRPLGRMRGHSHAPSGYSAATCRRPAALLTEMV